MAAAPQHHRYTILHAADNMPDFDPASGLGRTKSAKAFITRLRALQAHYGWSDFVLLEAAQQKLRGQARVWNEESPNVYTTFDAFEADLLATYPSHTSSADVLEEIFSQKREPAEGLEEFCRRMSVLGRRAQLPEDDMAQYIIKRIDHSQFVTSIGCVRVKSVAELLEAIAIFNQKWPQAQARVGPTEVQVPQSHTTTQPQPSNMAVQRDRQQRIMHPQQSSSSAKCWNCRTVGHTLRDCPAPKTV